jgi:hypothetical protein
MEDCCCPVSTKSAFTGLSDARARLLGVTKWAKVDETALKTVLRKQQRVIARSQALACGMTPAALQYQIRAGGPWQRLLPGVYLAENGTPTTEQSEIAALAHAGSGSVITGTAALRHHRVRAPDSPFITVLIPADRKIQNVGFVRVWRTARMPPRIMDDHGVRIVFPARAIADTARDLTSLPDVRAVVASAVQGRRCSVSLLAEELLQVPRRNSALLRQAVAEVCEGVRSVAEAEFRDLIRRAALPMPMFNPSVFLGRTFIAKPDAWWPEAGVAAEVDSREWHLRPEDWERTMRRHDAMTEHGILLLHFTPSMIRTDQAAVAAKIRNALKAGLARAPLDLRTLPATG